MVSPRRAQGDDFGVLFVCTANLCRSPIAEYLFDHAVARTWTGSGRWLVGSAGVAAPVDLPMHRRAAKALTEAGIDGSAFRTRRLSPWMLDSADLVLTATRDHRSFVARMLPGVLDRLFTVNQFGYLLSHAPAAAPSASAAEAGVALIEAVRRARSIVPARTWDDDLEDPVNRPMSKFRDVRTSLSDNLLHMRRHLGPVR